MNGEIPSVPITTLAGVSSLTELLPELPLPTPLQHTVNNKSLLYNEKIAEQAASLLNSTDDALVNQLVGALKKTSSENIELKDSLASDTIDDDVPALLKAILGKDQDVFKMPYSSAIPNHHHQVPLGHQVGGSHLAQQQPQHPSPYQAGHTSPCTPGSPARLPPQQPQSSPYVNSYTNPYVNHNPVQSTPTPYAAQQHYPPVQQQQKYHHMGQSNYPQAGPSNFQNQFLAFAGGNHIAQNSLPTVNGGSSLDYKPDGDEIAALGALSNSDNPMLGASPDTKLFDKKPVIRLQPLSADEITRASKNSKHKSDSKRKNSGDCRQPSIKLTPLEKMSKDELDAQLKHRGRRKKEVNYEEDDVYDGPSWSDRLSVKVSRSADKRAKRKRTDDEWKDDGFGMYASSLSDRVKRRKRTSYMDDSGSDGEYTPTKASHQDDMEYADTGAAMSYADMAKKRKKERKASRIQLTMNKEELMDIPSYKRFNSAIEMALESAEDVDLAALNADDEVSAVSDAIISRENLTELVNEGAKLKSTGLMNHMPYEKLVKLLAILQLNIKDGCKVLPAVDGENEDELWREFAMEKICSAVDAALTALYVMTSKDMPKEVYIEDVIDRIVIMAKMQLNNTIFPEFDPVYRVDPKSDKYGYQGSLKAKRARANQAKSRVMLTVYNKVTELIGTLGELIDIQELTDTIILQSTTLAVSPFFVENISELQLNSLKLITSIFSRYEKHRTLILEDILSSIARLPSSKKNLRNYRLNAEEQIQMVTALALELIQCVVKLPDTTGDTHGLEELDVKERERAQEQRKRDLMDQEVVIVTSYMTAMKTAHNFLAVFLRKCAMKGEEDYRPLFENFVYDLLSTVNKPEWPAAELLLSVLGRLLVQQFSNKSVDMSMRVASLDYLGIVAARLRKDAVTSKLNEDLIDDIIAQIDYSDDEDDRKRSRSSDEANSDVEAESEEKKIKKKKKKQRKVESDRTQRLQDVLLEHLAYNSQNDPALAFARQFYIAQWFRDCSVELEKANKKQKIHANQDASEIAEEEEKNREVLERTELRKQFLVNQIITKFGAFSAYKPSPSKLDYENSCLVTRYLASNRPFSQSFDIYLTQILKVLSETAVAVRTKAMKCLSAVVEADPNILARMDMQHGVHGRFLDQSTSVREAAVELVGKFILICPDLTPQYYEMLSERILDTGISVRKRVIKIFRDICIEQPDFPKISEMCVKMIRRVNDEEGIKKLVNETFQTMWFVPLRDKDTGKLLQKVMNVTDVVKACKKSGYDWFQQMLENLLKKEENNSSKPTLRACIQIIDCLVENVLRLEESSQERGSSPRLLACLSTLTLFCKVKPELLVSHAETIHPYLNIQANTPADIMVLCDVAQILELAVPLMEHPGEGFLAQLEADLMKLVLRLNAVVVQKCVSCLGAVVNYVSHNFQLVRDCFNRFFGILNTCMTEHQRDPNSPTLRNKPHLLRSLFTVGLLCKYFDFDSDNFGEKRASVKNKVFENLKYFAEHADETIRHKALAGLGFFCTRHFEFMLEMEMRDMYFFLLDGEQKISVQMRCQVLQNLNEYLVEEETKMMKADHDWNKTHAKEDLKEMGDIQSGMASTVIQVYLKHVLESFFHEESRVRLAALGVICLIMNQGLVHPVQCVPYLICMGTDSDSSIRIKADGQLQEIDKKYPGFIQMKALQGLKYSFRLQKLIQANNNTAVRGMRDPENGQPIALNHFLYSVMRNNRGQRRALLTSILNMFDETARVTLPEQLYMADNLAYFPFTTQDEPLFIIHQVDILVSVSGSNLLQSFQEFFYPGSTENKQKHFDEEEDEDLDSLLMALEKKHKSYDLERKDFDMQHLQELYLASQGCVLLLVLKQHLKDLYGFTDAKIHRYTPTESAKVFDKQLNRKHNARFNPKQVLEIIQSGRMTANIDEEARRLLLDHYLDFKKLMLSIDPEDEDDEEGKTQSNRSTSVSTPLKQGPHTSGNQPVVNLGMPVDVAMGAVPYATGNGETANNAITMDDDSNQAPGPNQVGEPAYQIQQTGRLSITISALKIENSMKKHKDKHRHSSSHRKKDHKHKHKKKKKKRHWSDSESEEDESDDSDPDFHG